nr:hypothetical protein [Micromonospora sp. DSM 115978]
MTAELEGVAEALIVRPGDTLIVRFNQRTARSDLDPVDKALREQLPGVDVIVINAEQIAVFRPTEQAIYHPLPSRRKAQ